MVKPAQGLADEESEPKKKKKRGEVPPVVVVVTIAATLLIILVIGFRTALAPPPTVHGIGRDGKPMTDADVDALVRAMTGGKIQKAPGR